MSSRAERIGQASVLASLIAVTAGSIATAEGYRPGIVNFTDIKTHEAVLFMPGIYREFEVPCDDGKSQERREKLIFPDDSRIGPIVNGKNLAVVVGSEIVGCPPKQENKQ